MREWSGDGLPLKSAGTSAFHEGDGGRALRRLAAIVETSVDAIVTTDLAGLVTSWNAGATRMFGHSEHEMLGAPLATITPPDRVREERELCARVRDGEVVEALETSRWTKERRVVHVTLTATPLRGPDGDVVEVSRIFRDVTALKEKEREVSRLSRLYAALSQVNEAIVKAASAEELLGKVCSILTDYNGFRLAWIGWYDPTDHRLVPVAAAGDETSYVDAIRVYADLRPEGRGPSGTAFRENRPYVCSDMFADPATLPWRAEVLRRGFRGSAVFPIHKGGVPVATLNVYAGEVDFFRDEEVALLSEAAGDVSFALDALQREEDRKRAEVLARNEKQFSDSMIESMPGVLYFYDEQGRFLRWNRNFETVSGYSGEEVARMHPLDFFAGEDRERLADRIGQVFARGESSVEAGFRCKDGRSIPYFFTGRRVEIGETRCLIGVGIDISERKQAEQALRELNETLEAKVAERTEELRGAVVRAEAADRLKSAFLATMSHELRTPLNSIIGFTGIVLQELAGPLNPEQHKQLGMVRSSARHLLELINDVLDLSKIEANQLEVHARPFHLPDVVARAVATVRPLAEKKALALSLEVSPLVGEVVSDARRVEQVLLNLLNNAVKFTERGEIRVVARMRDGAAAGSPCVAISVVDTGIGIKPADLDSLFLPFRQVDSGITRQHEGTGLGLAICRRLATLLGGEITVASTWGVGSEFTFVLPVDGARGGS